MRLWLIALMAGVLLGTLLLSSPVFAQGPPPGPNMFAWPAIPAVPVPSYGGTGFFLGYGYGSGSGYDGGFNYGYGFGFPYDMGSGFFHYGTGHNSGPYSYSYGYGYLGWWWY